MLYKNHHTVLPSATGLGSPNSKLKKGHPLRLRRCPEQLAVCFLCRAHVRTSDFRFATRTFLIFRTHCPWDVKWVFLLSIAVSLYWAENWKLSPDLIFLRFASVRSNKFRQKVVKLGRR